MQIFMRDSDIQMSSRISFLINLAETDIKDRHVRRCDKNRV